VDLTAWLGVRPQPGIRWGLGRVRTLLSAVGDPQRAFAAVHVAGTNGKGSVAALIASVLTERGHRTGLYTSPHLVEFRERIVVGGVPVDEETIARDAARLAPTVAETGATFFEATTALAFLCFAEAAVEVAVVEVGLGGRLDATNVLQPLGSTITNVAWDHAEYLGSSLSAIAREKAGILKAGTPASVGLVGPELEPVFRSAAAERGARLAFLREWASLEGLETGLEGTRLRYASPARPGGLALRTPLPGMHQAWNAALAAMTLDRLPQPFRPDDEELRRGFAAVRWPGRLQVERTPEGAWVFDVAHNPAGVEALAAAIGALPLPRPLVVLVAILGDKPWAEMLPPLLRLADASFFSMAPSAPLDRRWDAAAAARSSGLAPAVELDFERALARARAAAGTGTVLVTGSCYTVGDAMRLLGFSTLQPSATAG
jgi:dihydrofolate synthase/folylpolyglutamate synthase